MVLQEFYLTLRSKYRSKDSTPITTRQLESMIRLVEGRARAELRDEATRQDALEVVEIMRFSLWKAYEDEFGNVEFERSQGGAGMSKKGEPKRFMTKLTRVAAEKISINVPNFRDFVESLNMNGYLLKKGNRLYSIAI
ncbi:DNA replication licensing factor mcm8 [Chytriomyces hyalinus]|nr:DNA replication licensing factor mcm8 [Chytriomyces hyalinus]